MKTYSSSISNYRAAGKQFEEIDYVSFQVRDRSTNALVWKHFTTRSYDETVQVVNQSTGSLENRSYVGGGTIVAVPSVVRSEGTKARAMSFTLSGTSTPVLDMIQGYDARDAVIELHIGEADQDTGLLIDTPVCEFEGFVTTIDREDGGVAIDSAEPADSNFTVSVTSHIATLSRINPDMRSREIGQERSSDDIFRFAAASVMWRPKWGKKDHRYRDQRNGDGRDPRPPKDGWGNR